MRPEGLVLAADGAVAGTVEVVEELGSDAYVYVTAEVGGEERMLTIRTPTNGLPVRGEAVRVGVRPAAAHFFDPSTGLRL